MFAVGAGVVPGLGVAVGAAEVPPPGAGVGVAAPAGVTYSGRMNFCPAINTLRLLLSAASSL